MSINWSGRAWKPVYLHIVRLWWSGMKQTEIADMLDVSPAMVMDCINSERGQEMLSQLETKTLDTMLETALLAQAAAPQLMAEKVRLGLYSPDERVRTKNASDVLAIAGHVPLHRVSLERADPLAEKYRDATPEDLRKDLLQLIRSKPTDEGGPDGRLLN